MLPCVWFSNRSQKTAKCGKNISDTLGYASCATFFVLTVICDLLLNRRTAAWNLFVKLFHQVKSRIAQAWSQDKRRYLLISIKADQISFLPRWSFACMSSFIIHLNPTEKCNITSKQMICFIKLILFFFSFSHRGKYCWTQWRNNSCSTR